MTALDDGAGVRLVLNLKTYCHTGRVVNPRPYARWRDKNRARASVDK